MGIRDVYEDYRRKIKFADLDLASRSMGLLWLENYQKRVFRVSFPKVSSRSLKRDIEDLLNKAYFEGYILSRAVMGTGTDNIIYSNPEKAGDVEGNISRLIALYEQANIATTEPVRDPGAESVARFIVMKIASSPLLTWVEERELLRLHIEYALKAGYLLAIFERRLQLERG